MALSGIRVIDLTRILAGPFCTLMLADMGAEVIKIEPPKGDPVRQQGIVKNGLSWYFAQFNRNKKSVILDLYSEEGKKKFGTSIGNGRCVGGKLQARCTSENGFSTGTFGGDKPEINSCKRKWIWIDRSLCGQALF